MDGNIATNRIVTLTAGGSIVLLNAVALALLWVRRRSVLDLWLMVMCCAWLAETMVVANVAGRFTFGFYFSRLYAFVAVFSVLLVLLSETMALYSNPRLFGIKAAQQPGGAKDCHGRSGGFHRS
jgi:hypothetical protein